MNKLRNGDLDQTMTVRQALEMMEDVKQAALDDLQGTLEHWTDDEGLHRRKFDEMNEREMPEAMDRAAEEYLKQAVL